MTDTRSGTTMQEAAALIARVRGGDERAAKELMKLYLRCTDKGQRVDILRSLAASPYHPTAITFVIDAIYRSPDIMLLGFSDSIKAANRRYIFLLHVAARKYLDSPSVKKRLYGVEILHAGEDRDAIVRLMRERNEKVLDAAMFVVETLGIQEAVPSLIYIATARYGYSEKIRARAIHTLAKIAKRDIAKTTKREIAAVILRLMKDENPVVAAQAVESAGRCYWIPKENLIEMLDSPHEQIVIRAIEGIGARLNDESIPVLRKVAKETNSPAVKEAVKEAVRMIRQSMR